MGWDDDCCEKNLKVNKLCAKCVKAECIKAKDIRSDSACVSEDLQASSGHFDQLSSNNLCARSGVINNLCVDNLRVGNYIPCVSSRATANFAAASTPYTLGADMVFDAILDDPSNDLSLVPFTTYTVPVDGYYLMTFKLNIANLATTPPVLGVPVANPELWVNGSLVREVFSPFLTFLNAQKVIMDSLITLQAGDVVSLKYNILGGSGLPVVGTIDILGGGLEDGNSLFKIILLSGLCGGGDQPFCDQCPIVNINCEDDPCAPCALAAPVLNTISANPESPRDYMVSWNSVAKATSYTLEQSATSDFANASIAAQGNILSLSVVDQVNGTYYYRVFASNEHGNSPFSNVQSIVINPAALAAPAPKVASLSALEERAKALRARYIKLKR